MKSKGRSLPPRNSPPRARVEVPHRSAVRSALGSDSHHAGPREALSVDVSQVIRVAYLPLGSRATMNPVVEHAEDGRTGRRLRTDPREPIWNYARVGLPDAR